MDWLIRIQRDWKTELRCWACRMLFGCVRQKIPNISIWSSLIKGVNLALQWQVSLIYYVRDFACFHHWISDTLTSKAHINMKASGEMLVRQQLETLQELVDEYRLTMDVTLNRAGRLTGVPQRCFKLHREEIAHAVGVHYYGDQVGHKLNCWYPQPNWAPGHKKESVFCQVSGPININRSHKNQSLGNVKHVNQLTQPQWIGKKRSWRWKKTGAS